jgi:hypothetical protein
VPLHGGVFFSAGIFFFDPFLILLLQNGEFRRKMMGGGGRERFRRIKKAEKCAQSKNRLIPF